MSVSIPTAVGATLGAARGKNAPFAFAVSSGTFAFPTDPIGTHTLTLTNVVVGSRIAIRDQANTTTLYDQLAAGSTVVITLSVYAGGSALNNWRIDIRQGSNFPYYQRYKTFMTATPGASSLFINQLPDQR